MAINFGELDLYGKVPAGELKQKIREIAYNGIREMLADTPVDQNARFYYRVDGIVNATEMWCEQIDEEVAHANAEMEQIRAKWDAEGDNNDAGA